MESPEIRPEDFLYFYQLDEFADDWQGKFLRQADALQLDGDRLAFRGRRLRWLLSAKRGGEQKGEAEG